MDESPHFKYPCKMEIFRPPAGHSDLLSVNFQLQHESGCGFLNIHMLYCTIYLIMFLNVKQKHNAFSSYYKIMSPPAVSLF